MKTQILTGTCLLAVIAAFYVFSREERPKPNVTEPGVAKQVGPSGPAEKEPDIFAIAKAEANLPADYVLTPEQKEKIMSRREEILRKQRAKEMYPTEDELKIMLKTPVEFYGRVLDQFDQPVVGADIRCSWPFIGPQESPVNVLSSALHGDFEIRNIKAAALRISVYPPAGYAEEVRDSKRIQIAKAPDRLLNIFDLKNATPEQLENLPQFFLGGAESYKGDKAKPVIFRLKKL
ncbi:MAG: hypothetical protein DVB22_001491 [Verrucomicrobia bacterium]|jgi:hypothetical protein|nr:MAG: hypothetical protein DVB22_001491 [Verrucomicrobiota bacterium]